MGISSHFLPSVSHFSPTFLPFLNLSLHFPYCFVDDSPFPPIFPPFAPIFLHFPPFPPVFPICPIFTDPKSWFSELVISVAVSADACSCLLFSLGLGIGKLKSN